MLFGHWIRLESSQNQFSRKAEKSTAFRIPEVIAFNLIVAGNKYQKDVDDGFLYPMERMSRTLLCAKETLKRRKNLVILIEEAMEIGEAHPDLYINAIVCSAAFFSCKTSVNRGEKFAEVTLKNDASLVRIGLLTAYANETTHAKASTIFKCK